MVKYIPDCFFLKNLSGYSLFWGTAIFLCQSLPCLGSTNTDSTKALVSIGLQAHYGFIIPHTESIRAIANSKPWGVEADLNLHYRYAKAWNYLRGYPRLGASVSYYNFGNPEVLGNAYTLLLYAEPFLSAHKRFSLSFRFGTGLAYLTKTYHPQKNPENLFFSAPVSFPVVVNLLANYRLNKHFLVRTGVTYGHISNGGLRQPNKGINFPTVTAGLNYALEPAIFPERQEPVSLTETPKLSFLVALLGSYPDVSGSTKDKAPLFGLTAYLSRRVGRLSALTAGGEWVVDFSIRQSLRNENQETDFQRGAILTGHELQIGRVRFSQQLGIYVYSPFKPRDPVYQRYGLEYHSPRKIFGGINIKAHRHVADFLDVRIGLRL